MTRTPSQSTAPRPDPDEIERSLRLLISPGGVTELRALRVSTPEYRRPHTVSGYYDDLGAAVRDAVRVSAEAKGTYFALNTLNPDLLARSVNRCRPIGEEPLTSDADVIRRGWLPIDLDVVRAADISSTDAEHEAALDRARQIRDALRREEWPDPILADSGNGAHLLYPVDLPADDGGLVKRTLQALAMRFNDERITIDPTVCNPARIWKLYGTPVRKGDHAPGRPHRLARLIDVPEALR